MTKTYTPAIFQPTIRPSWAGAMKYIPIDEKADILEAIVRFPENEEIDSVFWQETVLPDLKAQYKKFVETCESRGRGAKTYWGEHKLSISLTYDKHKDNLLKDKDKDKDNSRPVDNVDNFFEKKVLIEEGKFHIDETMPEYKDLLWDRMDRDDISLRVWKWIMSKYEGKEVKISFIRSLIEKFKN